MLRNGAVRALLERFRPDLIECQDSYNLPWAAIGPPQALSRNRAGRRLFYRFPDRLCRAAVFKGDGRDRWPERPARLCYRYCGHLYRRFDAVFALSENGGAAKLALLRCRGCRDRAAGRRAR